MSSKSLIQSFYYAIQGIWYSLKTQRNMRLHFLATLLVFVLAWALGLNAWKLAILVLAVAAVITAELMNTAIENVVDLLSPGFHPKAKIAKDVAAGAVLFMAISALAVGVLLFVVDRGCLP